jgi:hypothetical protein
MPRIEVRFPLVIPSPLIAFTMAARLHDCENDDNRPKPRNRMASASCPGLGCRQGQSSGACRPPRQPRHQRGSAGRRSSAPPRVRRPAGVVRDRRMLVSGGSQVRGRQRPLLRPPPRSAVCPRRNAGTPGERMNLPPCALTTHACRLTHGFTEHQRSAPARTRSGAGFERGLAQSRAVAELGDLSDHGKTLPGLSLTEASNRGTLNVHAQVNKPTPGAHHRVPVMLVYSLHESRPSVQVPARKRHRKRGGVAHVTYCHEQAHRLPLIARSWKRSGVRIRWR